MKKFNPVHYHSGVGKWYYTEDGVKRYFKKGMSEAECQQRFVEIVAKWKEENPGEGTSTSYDLLPISKLVDLYLAQHKLHNGKEAHSQTRLTLLKLVSCLGTVKYHLLPGYKLQQFLDSQETWNSETLRTKIGIIKAFFNFCVKDLDCKSNPAKRLQKPEVEPRGEEYLVSEQEKDLLLSLASPWQRQILELLWFTGARPSEILTAKGSEYDSDKDSLFKENHKTKNKGKVRQIVLNQQAKENILVAFKKHGQGYLFPGRTGKAVSARNFSAQFMLLVQKAKITHPCVPYSFRHTFAVRGIQQGKKPEDLARLLGNTLPVFLKHYAHWLCGLENLKDQIPS